MRDGCHVCKSGFAPSCTTTAFASSLRTKPGPPSRYLVQFSPQFEYGRIKRGPSARRADRAVPVRLRRFLTVICALGIPHTPGITQGPARGGPAPLRSPRESRSRRVRGPAFGKPTAVGSPKIDEPGLPRDTGRVKIRLVEASAMVVRRQRASLDRRWALFLTLSWHRIPPWSRSHRSAHSDSLIQLRPRFAALPVSGWTRFAMT